MNSKYVTYKLFIMSSIDVIDNLQKYSLTSELYHKHIRERTNVVSSTNTDMNTDMNTGTGIKTNKRKGHMNNNKHAARNAVPLHNPDSFIPEHSDTLFWCFYVILYGMEEYESIQSNHNKIEISLKYELATKMGGQKNLFKDYRIGKHELQSNLINDKKITLLTFYVLCAYHKINIIYIQKCFYNEYRHDDTIKSNVICYKNDKYSISYNKELTRDHIIEHYYKYYTLSKIIKPISQYKADEVKQLCIKLSIETVNDQGRPKTKPQLYNEILLYLG